MKRDYMKKVIFGASLLIAGIVGFAILCGAAVSSTFSTGSTNFVDIWRLFGVTPAAIALLILGAIGAIVALIGVFTKEK